MCMHVCIYVCVAITDVAVYMKYCTRYAAWRHYLYTISQLHTQLGIYVYSTVSYLSCTTSQYILLVGSRYSHIVATVARSTTLYTVLLPTAAVRLCILLLYCCYDVAHSRATEPSGLALCQL